jgi:hypothetical protein
MLATAPPPPAIAAFTDHLETRCATHPDALAPEAVFAFGPVRLGVRFIGREREAFFTDAIAHRRTDEVPGWTVWVIDEPVSGLRLPKPCWSWANVDERGTLLDFGDDFYAHYGLDYGVFTLVDFAEKRAFLWHRDVGTLPEWERSFPFRSLLHQLLRDESRYLLAHAGAVGTAAGGVLLTGRGGSGKSTATLACLSTELRYAGDDFVLIDAEEPYVHSLYNVAKLEAGNLPRFPHLAPLVANPEAMPADKGQVFLHQHFPETLIDGFPLRAILMPKFTGQTETRLRPATPEEALHALAPSTLYLLRADARLLRQLHALTQRLPAYWLETGTRLAAIPETITALLRS